MRLPQPYHPVFESEAFRSARHRRLLALERRPAGRQRRQGRCPQLRGGGRHAGRAGEGVRAMRAVLAPRWRHSCAVSGCHLRGLRLEPDSPADGSRSRSTSPTRRSDFFADGRSMRTPPEGTVPRERIAAPAHHHRRDRRRRARWPTVPVPGHARAARARPQALRHHLRHLPRAARRRRQHRGGPDGHPAAAVARASSATSRPGFFYKVITQGLRHDAVLRRRDSRGRALGGGGVPARAAAQPEHARPSAAARTSSAELREGGRHGRSRRAHGADQHHPDPRPTAARSCLHGWSARARRGGAPGHGHLLFAGRSRPSTRRVLVATWWPSPTGSASSLTAILLE